MSDYVDAPCAGKLMILEVSMKYNSPTTSPKDAALLPSHNRSDDSAARLFVLAFRLFDLRFGRVADVSRPPFLVGE
jgi:hypothetical protein